ncbi:hypothetical protein L2U69_11855 [Zavarzinia compransoris]|uniref:hypothetical protein n=1 Tax=Zavarzinia marina TaxID=2911065 RepID=UPI001F2C2D68|nr:hypothetical protein [Zavarzinia marina]MCF4166341.1 hypothetical protein [Zavarzinia marina]
MSENEETRRGPGRPRKDQDARRERIPLGAPRSKLGADQRGGFVRRWVNDTSGRLEQAQAAGYSFVGEANAISTDTGSRQSQVVGTREDGTPMRAYLMETPREFYEEDQALKQREVDKVDEAIKGGSVAGSPGVDGRYIPSQGIRYDPRGGR